jgi:hypothetical protein
MRKNNLTLEILLMKQKLFEIAEDIVSCKKENKSLQQDFCIVKNSKTKLLLKKELKSLAEERNNLSFLYRHMFIVYCEMKGISRDKIEPQCAKPLCAKTIKEIKIRYGEK